PSVTPSPTATQSVISPHGHSTSTENVSSTDTPSSTETGIPTETFSRFDDFATTEEPNFTFDDGWQLLNCNQLDYYLDQTCSQDTIEGAQYLSPSFSHQQQQANFRRITFDIEGDTTSFVLKSFKVSTKPIGSISNNDYAGIVYCAWTVEDQYYVGYPSVCGDINLSGPQPFQQLVELNWSNVAYVAFAGEVASASKGAKPVEFQIDDIRVCVPDDDV
ncbi:hypothetical protein BZA05DRAFT_413550, partial [Tricharina praecox]|uniref:uncharacterized protein n=1 Tax=Tricharina praecox TaxID=43433 RepID=UPI00221F2612